jgi:hypothetical protein
MRPRQRRVYIARRGALPRIVPHHGSRFPTPINTASRIPRMMPSGNPQKSRLSSGHVFAIPASPGLYQCIPARPDRGRHMALHLSALFPDSRQRAIAERPGRWRAGSRLQAEDEARGSLIQKHHKLSECCPDFIPKSRQSLTGNSQSGRRCRKPVYPKGSGPVRSDPAQKQRLRALSPTSRFK